MGAVLLGSCEEDEVKALLLAFSLISCTHVERSQHYSVDLDFRPKVENPTYTKNRPRLCFDEGHNNLSVEHGNYRAVLGLLESDGFEIQHIKGAFTKEVLKNCDVIYSSAVLGHRDYQKSKELAGHSAFSDEEISHIVEWVKRGGGLLVATDHRPMSNAAAKLISPFGIQGSIINVRNEKKRLGPFPEAGIFSISGTDLNEKSPIIRGQKESERIKKVFFFYGEALRGPKEADVFLRVGDGARIGGIEGDPEISAKEFPAAAVAVTFGKGRVVVLGDGTILTSKIDLKLNEKTGINRPGSDNVQLALNVFHWLEGRLNAL